MASQHVQLALAPLDNKIEYYSEWCIRMKVYLRSLGCQDLIDANADLTTAEQKELDAKAMEAIFRHLAPYALNFVKNESTAKQTWATLKQHYDKKTPANQLHLFDKLLKLKMAAGDDIIMHFTNFDSIINELRISGVTAINDEQFLSAVLLKSLGPEYITAVTAIAMTSKENLKVEIIKSYLKNYNLTLESPGPALFIPAKNDLTGQDPFGKRTHVVRHQVCDGGTCRGHIILGSSNAGGSYDNADTSISKPSGETICAFCMRKGHNWRVCRYRNRKPPTSMMLPSLMDEFNQVYTCSNPGNQESSTSTNSTAQVNPATSTADSNADTIDITQEISDVQPGEQ